jgi:putative flippase GtrA
MHESKHETPLQARRRRVHAAWVALSIVGLVLLGRTGAWVSRTLALPIPEFCALAQVGVVVILSRTWPVQRRWRQDDPSRRPRRGRVAVPLRVLMNAVRHGARSPLVQDLLRYMVVGATTTLLDFGLLNLVLHAFPSLPALALGLASGGSYTLTLILAYHWHRRWTFPTAQRTPAQAWRFVAINISTIAVNTLATVLLTTTLPLLFTLRMVVVVNISKASATLLSGGLNFAGNRAWVFQRPTQPARIDGSKVV